jgi:hypothetical protein
MGVTYCYDAFITGGTSYVLLDPGGDIRASSPDIEGIAAEKVRKGWGDIHECEYTPGKGLKIGKKVE